MRVIHLAWGSYFWELYTIPSGSGCDTMKGLAEGQNLNLVGPWWFFQLWLVATFEAKINFHIPLVHDEKVNSRKIEGFQLAHLTKKLTGRSTVNDFLEYYDVSSRCDIFESTMAPFVGRKLGPKWFQSKFPSKEPKYLTNNVEVWKAYLTPTFLHVRITAGKNYFKLIGYYPHLVAHQFGLSQFKPAAIATFCETIYENFHKMSEVSYQQHLSVCNGLILTMEPISFQISHECTESFSLWWHSYYFAHLVDDTAFRAKLTNAFPSLQSKSKKTKGIHIKEIHAFHKFFEIVYNPLNVERTVKEAALVLRQKMLEKLPNFTIRFLFREHINSISKIRSLLWLTNHYSLRFDLSIATISSFQWSLNHILPILSL